MEGLPAFADTLASVWGFVDSLPVEVAVLLPVSVCIFFPSFKEVVFGSAGYASVSFASVASVGSWWGTGRFVNEFKGFVEVEVEVFYASVDL